MEFKPQEPSTETQKPNETRKEVMEKAQDERLKLKFDAFKKILDSVLHAIELTPLGNITMGVAVVRGKRFFIDEKLSKKDRIMYGLIILHSSIYSTLFTYGVLKGDIGAVVLSIPIYGITSGLTIAQKRQEVKKNIPESVKKYGDSQNEQLMASKKTIEEYGYEKVKELIEKMKKEKKKR